MCTRARTGWITDEESKGLDRARARADIPQLIIPSNGNSVMASDSLLAGLRFADRNVGLIGILPRVRKGLR